MATSKIKTEKETLAKLIEIFGNKTVWLTRANSYGDRRKYAFGFSITEIAKRHNLKDNAPAGYSHQYDKNIEVLIVGELKVNGFDVVNEGVGSWVHGWVHRVITQTA